METVFLGTTSIELNPECNGGETITLETTFNGDARFGEVWMNQKLTLNSYGNQASLSMYGYLDPQKLRDMADQLEKAILAARTKLESETNCKLPPQGWECSRAPGHGGPCAATSTDL